MTCERCKDKGYLIGKDRSKRNFYCWPMEEHPESHWDHIFDLSHFPCWNCRPVAAELYQKWMIIKTWAQYYGLYTYNPKNKYKDYEDQYGKPFPDEYKPNWRH